MDIGGDRGSLVMCSLHPSGDEGDEPEDTKRWPSVETQGLSRAACGQVSGSNSFGEQAGISHGS